MRRKSIANRFAMYRLLEKLKRKFENLPFTSDVLKGELGDYSAKNAKIAALVDDGYLLRLKKGMYCLAPGLTGGKVDVYNVANWLYGPSYVSFETILSRHALIEDRTVEVISAVNRRGKEYNTPIGRFSYRTVDDNWFPIGVESCKMGESYVLVASPEKALADLLVTRENLRIASVGALRTYLQNDLRFDFGSFVNPDVEIFHQLAQCGRKVPLVTALERVFS